MKSDFFYIGIENPGNVRKGILEASKELIQILQRYEKLKAIRAEKYAQTARLKAIYDDVIAMLSDVKAELPAMDVKVLPKHPEKKYSKGILIASPAIQDKPVIKKSMTGIEKLEQELNEIEEKLKAIN